MFLNRVLIVGNLTRDPELKALPSGAQVASMSVATNRVWSDKEGNKQEETEYHSAVVFGKQAENCAAFLRKGSQVLIEGRLQTRSWESEGVKRYKTEIVADRVQFGSRPKNASPVHEPGVGGGDAQEPGGGGGGGPYEREYDINPDDIPF